VIVDRSDGDGDGDVAVGARRRLDVDAGPRASKATRSARTARKLRIADGRRIYLGSVRSGVNVEASTSAHGHVAVAVAV